MKKVASSAKTTAITVAKVPQSIGRTILAVPKTISKLSKKGKEEPKPKFADHIAFISKEILEDQGRRRIVRESQSDCMREICTHLESFLAEKPESQYEQWIAELHPDNAEYADGSIDHRFYVEDSDHRILWNEVMIEIDAKERVVDTKTVGPNYNRTEPN